MAFLDFFRNETAKPVQLPIFPLHSVLFPGGILPLKVFEARYMDMMSECLRQEQAFGVCLISEGEETGTPATPHTLGVTARIIEWDMVQLGMLQITVKGGGRFRILSKETNHKGLIVAEALPLPDEPVTPIPKKLQTLLPLLQAIVRDAGPERIPGPHNFNDAAWVGHRYSELLPIPLLARQKLLELDDPISRLEIIQKYLAQRDLL